MFKRYYKNQTKQRQRLLATFIVLLIAIVGTILLVGSHAAAPYTSTTADSGNLTSGTAVQPCSGSSDGNCVVFGGSGVAGQSNLFGILSSPWDQYDVTCQPNCQYNSWINQHFHSYMSYSTAFDKSLPQLPNAVVYDDSWAIYPGTEYNWVDANDPAIIMHDSNNDQLFINFACNAANTGSTTLCTQYAGNFANPQFINFWLTGCTQGNWSIPADANNSSICMPGNSGLEGTIAKGYKGVFMDDVNLNVDSTNASGEYQCGSATCFNNVSPIDTNTGSTMSAEAWSDYMASFTKDVRQALPNIEIIHNAPWFEGGNNQTTGCMIVPASCSGQPQPDVSALNEEIQSANIIDLERGVVDGGLSCGWNCAGDWTWSFDTFLNVVDYIHSQGADVIYQSYATDMTSDGFPSSTSPGPSADDKEYNLAAYFLTSNGSDLVGDGEMYPTTGTYMGSTLYPLWNGYNVNLGSATGARQIINNQYYERQFANGVVYLSPPGGSGNTNANPITINLTAGKYYEYNSSGVEQQVNQITLNPYSAAVLTTQAQ